MTDANEDAPRSSGPPTTVFVSDPSAEAERVAQALRGANYVVVDVPLAMLVARVAVQRPRVILVDADSDGALDAIARMRELPDADGIDVLFFARAGGALSTSEQALSHEGSGLFARPIEVESVLKKIEALTGGSTAPPPMPPPRRMSSRPPPSSSAVVAPASSSSVSGASLPPASMRVAEPISSRPPSPRVSIPAPLPSLRPSLPIDPGIANDGSRRPPTAPLSAELEQLLAEAEQRVPIQASPESIPPTPEEEIEAVLPAELLESLDEPLDDDDDDDAQESAYSPMHRATGVGGSKSTTGAAGTGVGSSAPGTRPGAGTGASKIGKTTGAHRPLGADTPAPVKTHGGTHPGTTGSVATTGERREGVSRVETGAQSPPAPPRVEEVPPQSLRGGSQPPPTAFSAALPLAAHDDSLAVDSLASPARAELGPPAPALATTVLLPGDAPRVVGRAIAARTTGSLAFDSGGTVRRVLLREGDVVTVASGSEEDSLLAFLGVRGELPRETVRRLAGKFPGFGRHGGAALVAHGYLRQDQLWPVLRAHAEWILGRMLLLASGTVALETDPPGRLRAEPGVFGGSTGAEVFVEVLRRVVAPPDAIERVGGASSRIGDGENASLLSECALKPRETELLGEARGKTVQQLLDAAGESDMATVLYAASVLGVIEVLRSVGAPAAAAEDVGPDVDALDEEAIRARVRARVQLVDEGDYFAVLGVAHNATGYEVRRAFLELRRAFEPSRILTPQVADLADDVRKVVSVLEEAYEILRDGARRERYRRAIDAVPV